MTARRSLVGPALATAGAAGGLAIVYSASRAIGLEMSLGLYALANLVLFLDLGDYLVRLFARRANTAQAEAGGAGSPTSIPLEVGRFSATEARLHLRPWAVLVSVHDAEAEVPRFVHHNAPLRAHVWVIDDASTDRTAERLRRAGYRCLEGDVNRHKPGAIRALLAELPPEIETVMVIDPDVEVRSDELERVVFELQRSGFDAVAPRVTVRRDGFLALFQAFEYEVCSGIGRKSLGDAVTNPGVSLYRRDALAAALERHSQSVYAEDLENSVQLLDEGARIYYDERFVVETEGKRTLRSWFSQRVGWAFGLLRVYAERLGAIRRLARRGPMTFYQYLAYFGLFGLLAHPLRLVALALLTASALGGLDLVLDLGWLPAHRAFSPTHFVVAYLQYTMLSALLLLTAVPRGSRLALLPVVPVYFFYGLLQIAPITVGYANYLGLRLLGRRLYRDHYQSEPQLVASLLARDRLAPAPRAT